MEQVDAAAPVLWANGYLNTQDESVGLRIYGVEPESKIYSPFRDGLISGEFLQADDRSGILIGKRLADDLELGAGDSVRVAIINADGQPDETDFTIRGVYKTGVFSYDDSALLMPLSKAQAFANTGGRASAVTMWLNNEEDAEAVAAALQQPEVKTLTWRTLNEFLLETFETSQSVYVYMYGIVILIVAVLIANTLLMAVFERIREIGILAALGMKTPPDHDHVSAGGRHSGHLRRDSGQHLGSWAWPRWPPTASRPATWARLRPIWPSAPA